MKTYEIEFRPIWKDGGNLHINRTRKNGIIASFSDEPSEMPIEELNGYIEDLRQRDMNHASVGDPHIEKKDIGICVYTSVFDDAGDFEEAVGHTYFYPFEGEV